MSAHPDLAGGRLTIDLDALVSNWKQLGKNAPNAECAAVVKANAYGCGIQPVVEALEKAGCKTFFVALPEEGIRVKTVTSTARCFVLNGLFPDAAPYLIEAGLMPVLGSWPEIETWAAAAKKAEKSLACAIQLDSGMGRFGLSAKELERLIATDHLMNGLEPHLFMTHYACADDVGHPKTNMQRETFVQASYLLPGTVRSAANSAAILQTDGHEFDLVRPGIAMYGGEALNHVPNPMKPVVTLEGRILSIRDVKAGDTVGYGGAEIMIRDSRVAHLSLGYADGYHRASSNMGVEMRVVAGAARAAYKGTIVKGVGRVSMDLCAFDVTDIPEDEIKAGDWLELFGKTIPVDDVARAAGTIGYELLTGLGNRYSRKYVGG